MLTCVKLSPNRRPREPKLELLGGEENCIYSVCRSRGFDTIASTQEEDWRKIIVRTYGLCSLEGGRVCTFKPEQLLKEAVCKEEVTSQKTRHSDLTKDPGGTWRHQTWAGGKTHVQVEKQKTAEGFHRTCRGNSTQLVRLV